MLNYMNKYTNKILYVKNKFVFELEKPIQLHNNDIIKKIMKIIDTYDNFIYNSTYDIKKIKKLHDKKYPLVYKAYKKTEKNPMSFLEFIQNQHEINWDSIDINIDDEDRSELNKILYNNSFVSLDIQHHAETVDLDYIRILTDEFELFVYSPEGNENIKSDINEIIKIIKIMIDISKEFECKNKKPHIIMFLGKQKKYLDNNIDIFTCEHVNSGSTYLENYVSLWRYEEHKKVLIHELVHYYNIDFFHTDPYYYTIDKMLEKHFTVTGVNRPNEIYTESLTVIIYLCYYSNLLNDDINKLFLTEVKFMIFQMAKIINYYNGNSYDQLFTINYKQKTSVLSYYILKTFIIYNIELFTEYIIKNGLQCKNNKIEIFSELLEDVIIKMKDNKNMKNLCDSYLDIIKKNKDDIFIFKTMRMTCQ